MIFKGGGLGHFVELLGSPGSLPSIGEVCVIKLSFLISLSFYYRDVSAKNLGR